MNYSYEQSIEICEKALDLIDIRKFLVSNIEVEEIMWDISYEYADFLNKDYDALEDYMRQYPEVFGEEYQEPFNFMTEDEFIKYCKKRYPDIKCGHKIIEKYWVI